MSFAEQLDKYQGMNGRIAKVGELRERVLTVRMEPALYTEVKQAAHREHISMNGYVVSAIREVLRG